jgi:hypothetical protein
VDLGEKNIPNVSPMFTQIKGKWGNEVQIINKNQ